MVVGFATGATTGTSSGVSPGIGISGSVSSSIRAELTHPRLRASNKRQKVNFIVLEEIAADSDILVLGKENRSDMRGVWLCFGEQRE